MHFGANRCVPCQVFSVLNTICVLYLATSLNNMHRQVANICMWPLNVVVMHMFACSVTIHPCTKSPRCDMT